MKENLSKLIRSPHSLASLPHGTPVLVALSGGADSTLLLRLLAELSAKESEITVLNNQIAEITRSYGSDVNKQYELLKEIYTTRAQALQICKKPHIMHMEKTDCP